MKVFNAMIRSCTDFFFNSNIQLDKMQDYEVVCKTLLAKYGKLKLEVTDFCRMQNANPTKKAVKRLNTHVSTDIK